MEKAKFPFSKSLVKFLAFAEVIIVTFGGVPLLTLGIYRIFPRFESWQTERLSFPFPIFVQVVMMAVPLAGIQIGLLFALGWLLRKKPSAGGLGVMAGGIALSPWLPGTNGATAGKALVLFLTYAFFVGFGEEMLYRGYMQSRLNEAFGKPYKFFGVSFGWGAILTAVLFGMTHVGILSWILGRSTQVTLAWGFWTIFGGLVFSFVREKSGSVLAPALLHGLPQAIATVAMLYL